MGPAASLAPTPAANDELFLIEGTLTELHVELGKENLLAKIDKHYRAKGGVTGAVGAVGDLFGQAASGAMLAMYDGEDTQNFVCLVDGQVMCGQFGGAEMLQEGDNISAVVSREENVLCAHAIMSRAQGVLWTSHPWGVSAESVANLKIALWCFLFQLFCVSTMLMVSGWSSNALEMLQISIVGGSALCFGMALWANSDMKAVAGPATAAFRLLGFANPERVNLNKYGLSTVSIRDHLRDRTLSYPTQNLAECQHRSVYCYQRAIDDGKLAFACPADELASKGR